MWIFNKTCTCVCMYVHMQAHMQACMHMLNAHIHIDRLHARVMCIYARKPIFTHVCMHACMHTNHKNKQARSLLKCIHAPIFAHTPMVWYLRYKPPTSMHQHIIASLHVRINASMHQRINSSTHWVLLHFTSLLLAERFVVVLV